MKGTRSETRLFWVLVTALTMGASGPVFAAGGKGGRTAKGASAGKGAASAASVDENELDEGGEEGGQTEGIEEDVDRELYIKNIVHSATKTTTTVQEAPAVIHIITAEDIAAFGYRNLMEVLNSIPGFLEANTQYDQMPLPVVRGTSQAILYLRDGLSLFDPIYNIQSNTRRIPLETIKRIEATTSPGGVLWGANSFMGIANIITKDPDDVNGIEIGVGGGTGPGDEDVMRPYLMYGKSFFKGQFQILAHWSVEMFRGPRYSMPQLWLYSPPPRLGSIAFYRNVNGLESKTPESMYSQVDGKVIYAKPSSSMKVSLVWQFSFNNFGTGFGGLNKPLGFLAAVARNDSSVQAMRENQIDFGDSYAFLQFKDRWLDNRLGLTTKAYYVLFDRPMHADVLPSTEGVLSGVKFNSTTKAHRTGMTFDMDFLVHRGLRLLFGGEAFYQWVKNADVSFSAPLDANGQVDMSKISVVCPYRNTNGDGLPVYDPNNPQNTNYVSGCRQPFVFDSDQFSYAVYLAGEYRPHKSLVFNAGVRLQQAPLGNVTYGPQILYTVAGAWNFYKAMYLKANYSTGFRSPVFGNTSNNGAAVNYGGNPDIKTEKSQAAQVEWIARLLRGGKYIRQWDMRVDYSYTTIQNYIRILRGGYVNSTDRGIHSVEFLTQLYLKGGHRLRLAYTYFYEFGASKLDGGPIRSIPNQWLSAGAVFKLFEKSKWRLDFNTTFRLIGSFEDPNRLIKCPPGNTMNCSATASDLTYDHIAPAGLLNLGVRLRGKPGGYPVEFTANVYNALNNNYWTMDAFYELGPRIELVPTRGQGVYFYLQGKARF